ncbi:MAG: prepilin-type N-terminal cleavage/methylation domain-containing protein [Pirellulales bacterium]
MMISGIRSSLRTLRNGFTLLELLVVILIMLSVTAVTIPVIAPAMRGRQIREGARMVTTFLNAARNRAIETNRPAGVWIERMPGMREASVSLHFAEIPPAYAGDFLDSSIESFVVNGNPADTAGMVGTFFNWPRTDTTCKDYWNVIVPRSRTTMNMDSWASPDPADQSLVREGDLIQIEGDDRQIPLKTVKMQITGAQSASSKNLWWYLYRGRNCATNVGPDGTYLGSNVNRHWDGSFIINWFDRSFYVHSDTIRITTWMPMNPNVTGLKYKIFRQPIKLQAGSIKLPESVVIDLNFSSMTDGTTSGTSNNGTVGAAGTPFHPRRDPGDTTNVKPPFWGDPVFPQDETPIIVVFSAGGSVERVYMRYRDGSGANAQWPWQGVEPGGMIHLLVGKLDRIIPHEQYYMSQTATENLEIQKKKNWLDLDNLWVTVEPTSGFISTALVDNVDVTNATNFATQAANPQYVYVTRARARLGRVVGGR